MPKPTIAAIQAATAAFITKELSEKQQVSFSDIREHINAVFAGAQFNWMTAVRSPMQVLINAGIMKRTADVTKEVYVVIA